MGAKSSKPGSEGVARSKVVDKYLEDEKRMGQGKSMKLLLLGTGDSGKSTLLKQMKLIYGSGFTDAEREMCLGIIYTNIVSSMQMLITEATKHDSLSEDAELQNHCDHLLQLTRPYTTLEAQSVAAVKALWPDRRIQAAYARRNVLHLNQHCGFFFDHIDRVATSEYVPEEEDILKVRMPTTGVVETHFVVRKRPFRVMDVGGQRSERRKWIQCFADVNAVIFVTAISEIDQYLFEDENTPRIEESLNLFEDIVNNDFFKDTPVILFMNKDDILQEKLAEGIDPHITCPKYDDGCDYDLFTSYLKTQFHKRNKNPKREIYIRTTNALDRENMEFVFAAVIATILDAKLEEFGFM